VVCVSNCHLGKVIHQYIKQLYSSLKVEFYSKDTGNKEDFDDVNSTFIKYDVIIYTPTLTAGVSFEASHFDIVYGIFDPESCDSLLCS
jgi:hypothetical protein